MAPADGAWAEAERVLVVRLDNVGDIAMLTPALRALRSALPDAELTLMASPTGARMAPLLPGVDRVMVEEVLWQALGTSGPPDPAREQALVGRIAGGRFDVALIFTSFSQSPLPAGYACVLAGIPLRVGQSKEFGGGVLSHELPSPPDECHQVDRNLALLEGIDLPLAGSQLELVVPATVRAEADSLLADMGIAMNEGFVALAPGASASARRYDPGRFGQVARGLVDELGLPVVVVGAPGDEVVADQVVSAARAPWAAARPVVAPTAGERGGSVGATPRTTSLCGRTSVPELAAVVQRASLVVANDSGAVHLADALARPVVVTFAGTDLESQWRPRSSPSRLLRRPTWCAPCYQIDCPYDQECLDIDPADVVSAAVGLLPATASAPPSAG